ncbi:hypothetical protein PIIN_10781, partial [Serendipita indica DSM 11827]
MSSLRSRLKGIIRISNPSSQTVSDKEAAVPGLDLSKPSPSRTKSKKDDLGFLELVSGTDPIVDIIAVHGLDGHREKTWTAEKWTSCGFEISSASTYPTHDTRIWLRR